MCQLVDHPGRSLSPSNEQSSRPEIHDRENLDRARDRAKKLARAFQKRGMQGGYFVSVATPFITGKPLQTRDYRLVDGELRFRAGTDVDSGTDAFREWRAAEHRPISVHRWIDSVAGY